MNLCDLVGDIAEQLDDWGLFDIPLLGSRLYSIISLLGCLFCGGV